MSEAKVFFDDINRSLINEHNGFPQVFVSDRRILVGRKTFAPDNILKVECVAGFETNFNQQRFLYHLSIWVIGIVGILLVNRGPESLNFGRRLYTGSVHLWFNSKYDVKATFPSVYYWAMGTALLLFSVCFAFFSRGWWKKRTYGHRTYTLRVETPDGRAELGTIKGDDREENKAGYEERRKGLSRFGQGIPLAPPLRQTARIMLNNGNGLILLPKP